MTVWTQDPTCTATSWGDASCQGNANWTKLTICRRPYGRSLYGRGPYGRCAIIGLRDWEPPGVSRPYDPLWAQDPEVVGV